MSCHNLGNSKDAHRAPQYSDGPKRLFLSAYKELGGFGWHRRVLSQAFSAELAKVNDCYSDMTRSDCWEKLE